MRLFATPNDITTETDTLELPGLEEALIEALSQTGTASPVTPEAQSPTETLSPTTPRTRRMSTNLEGETANTRVLEEQIRELRAIIEGRRVREPKIKSPETFDGTRKDLRRFLAALKIYFQSVGWQTAHNEEKTLYAVSLLRGGAATWVTPYIETPETAPWTTWDQFVETLREQFGDFARKQSARNQLEGMRQGTKTINDMWHEFRIISTDAEYDDATLQTILLKTMNGPLQQAWATANQEFATTEALAKWAIGQEHRLNQLRQIQKGGTTQRVPDTPRNNDGTFKTTNAIPRGDPMDLDAVGRKGRFLKLPTQEYRRRISMRLCLVCGEEGHIAKECRNPRSRGPKQKIRTISTEDQKEGWETLKEEGPQ